ncbi:MAG: inorganic pyrophosphatase [Candidatus Magasanikbacteria bacterium CG11_big_fil_rev_8_21_14_0_20_39_34]|uniref:Inorganic pyrophosphatase n=1 Tax=Candidatus Magasanikbacteria bacterium CG11_big_fil_rev_8_21_14_0_20_39_34 TaxID=1974653 RepID=A0A2H0N4V4_9BACT|nr:MAG: inorganic pyrophosphatase [Candidatus Magasanikbacteria bacterium CG11_big_fil_rev_8_21_14_0_20_39_34]
MNLWHDVSLGEKAPEKFNVIVEVPKGSRNKYELDKDTGMIKLDRANYSFAAYPFEYCFVPQTLWDDGDAIDVVLLATHPLFPGVLVEARPVAFMKMIDSGEDDSKIIAVPTCDKRFDNIQDLSDLNPHNLKEIQHFFETYKALKGETPDQYKVEVPGFEPKNMAIEALNKSVKLYQEKFAK